MKKLYKAYLIDSVIPVVAVSAGTTSVKRTFIDCLVCVLQNEQGGAKGEVDEDIKIIDEDHVPDEVEMKREKLKVTSPKQQESGGYETRRRASRMV